MNLKKIAEKIRKVAEPRHEIHIECNWEDDEGDDQFNDYENEIYDLAKRYDASVDGLDLGPAGGGYRLEVYFDHKKIRNKFVKDEKRINDFCNKAEQIAKKYKKMDVTVIDDPEENENGDE